MEPMDTGLVVADFNSKSPCMSGGWNNIRKDQDFPVSTPELLMSFIPQATGHDSSEYSLQKNPGTTAT